VKWFSLRRNWLVASILCYGLGILVYTGLSGFLQRERAVYAQSLNQVFANATTSSPIVISNPVSAGGPSLVWVVNPDDDTVSVLRSDTNTIVKKINVGDEPQSVAVDPNNQFAYVANAASNTVTVIKITNPNPANFVAAVDLTVGRAGTFTTGAEPWNVVISPDGKRVFVANSGQDTITVIDATNRTLIGNVELRNSACNGATDLERQRHFQPRGLAVTADNTQLYVTQFLSFVKAGGTQGSDVGKEGAVCRILINTAAPSVAGYVPTRIALAATITGFRIDSNGDTVPDDTSAYPNQMQSIVIRGDQAYLPNIAASPSRPLRFNVDTHAYVNRIGGVGTATQIDNGALNLHLGARIARAGRPKIFFANPWAMAFTNGSGAGSAYVVSAGSDGLVKLNVNAAGELSFTDGVSTTLFIDLNDPDNAATSGDKAGKNPLGIAITADGSTAYVMNYVSRNVSVVNLATDTVSTVIQTTELPPVGTLDEIIQVGKEIFFSSRGVFDRPTGTTVSTRDRLSSEGWQNCASCHFAGLTDGNIWQFGTGPRKSVPLNGTWNPNDPDDQRVLNYSAIFDEVQDFEANIRNVSGPGNLPGTNPPQLDPNHGLIFGATINDAPAAVPPLQNLANAGRPQHTVTLPGNGRGPIPALDAMSEWARFGIRTPNGALTATELTSGAGNATGGLSATDIVNGRRLFVQAGCQTCHGGGKWTVSSKDFTSPVLAALVEVEDDANGATAPNPNAGQSLFGALKNIDSFNLNVPGQNKPIPGQTEIGAVEIDAAGRDALGIDYDGDGKGLGFNPPSLLGIHALQPYYHNGACETLACVMANVRHRTAGLTSSQSDLFTGDVARRQIIAFLESIDAQTAPPTNLRLFSHDISFDPPTLFVGQTVTISANISFFGPKVPTFDPGPLKVTFFDGIPGQAGTTEIGTTDLVGVDVDFGQVTLSVPWQVPNTVGVRRVTVVVDSTNLFAEERERDNTASRSVFVRAIPPDRVLPIVSSVRINNDAVSTTSNNVSITFAANDPPSTAPAPTSGLDSFCIVRYSYRANIRRWVEENCRFVPLPAANNDGTFTIQTRLPDRFGVAYAFVWVKDGAGNISRRPGFDFINVVPDGTLSLSRNDTRILRITLDPGQATQVTVTPTVGDIDLSVFAGVAANAPRVAVSAENGLAPETVAFSVPADGTRTIFQVEIRAVVFSRFTLGVSRVALASLPAQSENIATGKEIPDTPFVAGPPALTSAIEDPNAPGSGLVVRLPMMIR
jgi:YVTN family beta-propeller protein